MRQKKTLTSIRARIVAAFLISVLGTAFAGTPANTGAFLTSDGRDQAYTVIGDTTGQISATGADIRVSAYLVPTTLRPASWGSLGAASVVGWIGPAADQTTGKRAGCCFQTWTAYETAFTVADPTQVNFTASILAKDYTDVYLNGTLIFSGSASQITTPVKLTVTSSMVKTGTNLMHFQVFDDTGGPTGLQVLFTDNLGQPPATSTSYCDSTAPFCPAAPSRYRMNAAADPVDSATGQFYDQTTDLALGGQLGMRFARYYSSILSAGGFKSSLGTNWMSNFDAGVRFSDTTAEVLMFGGKVIKFNKVSGLWQLKSPLDAQYQLLAAGSGFQFLDPDSNRIYTFSSTGVLTQIRDRNGNAITVTPGTNGPTAAADNFGRTLTFTYTNNQLASVTDQAGRTVRFNYTGGLLTSATDAQGNVTGYAYTTAGSLTGLMTQKTWPTGKKPNTQTYDTSGRVITQADPNKNTFAFAFDGKGGTKITSPLGDVITQTSDVNGNIGALADPSGASAKILYDSNGRRTSVTDKLGNTTTYTYVEPTGLLASVKDPLGNTTNYTYTPQSLNGFTFNNLTGITYADGTSSAFTYDANGNVLSAKRPDGALTQFVYDANGRVTKLTDAKGGVTTFAYDSAGLLASTQDALGNTTAFTYDSAKLLSKVTDASGAITSFTVDALGHVTGMLDATGGLTKTVYDADNNIDNWTPPLGGQSKLTYSPTGRIATMTDPLGNTSSYQYNAADQLVQIKNAAGEFVTYTYDALHRISGVSDNAGPRTTFTYDAEGRVTSATDGAGRKTTYAYDALGRPLTITAPSGARISLTYDKLGRLIGKTSPLGEKQTIVRNAAGQMTQITLPGDLTSSIQLDAFNQPSAITDPTGSKWLLSFDALGRPSKFTDPLGNSSTTTYSANHLAGATLPLGSVTFATDKRGRITQRKYSDGTTFNYTYDAAGLLVSTEGVTVTRNTKGFPVNINGLGITYTPADRPASITYAPGKVVTYGYDSAGRIATITDWLGGKTTFAYDASSRLTGMTYPNGVATAYTYDADGLLTKIAAGSIGTISLIRDAAQKIVSADRNFPLAPTINAPSRTFAYDAAGQLTGSGISYDKMGRVTSQNGRTYTWNLASQLTAFADGTNSGTLTYDGLNGLISSSVSGAVQTYVRNYAFSLPAVSIVRSKGADLRYYIHDPYGALLYSVEASNNSRHFYHFDEMGNTLALTGDDGKLTDGYAYTPYGEIVAGGGATENPFTWQGRFGVMREAGDLFYMGDRHYEATSARFISRDPLFTPDPRSTQPYTYARSNPLRYIDPTGDLSWSELSDASDLIGAIYLKTIVNRSNGQPDDIFASAVAFLKAGISAGDCLDLCAAEGWELVDYLAANPKISWDQLAAALDHPAPKPPPARTVVAAAPPPVVLQPVSGQSTCAQVQCNPAAALVLKQGSLVAPLISQDGNNLISQDGNNVVSNDGGTLVSHDGGSVVSNDGGTVVSHDGGSVIGEHSSGIIGEHGSGILGENGSGVIGEHSSGIIGFNGSGVIGEHGSGLLGNH